MARIQIFPDCYANEILLSNLEALKARVKIEAVKPETMRCCQPDELLELIEAKVTDVNRQAVVDTLLEAGYRKCRIRIGAERLYVYRKGDGRRWR